MAEKPFDKASRYLAALDPLAFLGWLFRQPAGALEFRGWIDTRGIAFPGEPDRVGDTVAHIVNTAEHGVPWAFAIEFQIQPGEDMFGRLLGYLSGIWLNRRPDDERGSRFNLGAAVVNLTGTGSASREMSWPTVGAHTTLRVVERNLEHEPAEELVSAVESGGSRCLLPWVPLMSDGENADTVERWKALALAEPDRLRRAQFAAIALLFARRVGRGTIWEEKLKGWNMEESTYVNEWIAVGEKRGEARGKEIGGVEAARANVLRGGTRKFGAPPEGIEAVVNAISDRARLERMLDRLFDGTATGWADLVATA